MNEFQIKQKLPNRGVNDILFWQHKIERYGPDTTLKEVLDDVTKRSPWRTLKYKCPKCKGTGYIVTEYNAYPSGLPDSGWVYKPGYDYEICILCNGYGFTRDEYKAKTKTEIIGYEKVLNIK